MLDHLWNGWRAAYVTDHVADRDATPGEGSVFTRILRSGLPDRETNIVHRGDTCFVIMNAFPYTSGHLMVLPYREVADLDELDAVEAAELWATVTRAVGVLRLAYRPEGLNVGINLGRPAGGSVSEHLHVHVVPRWIGDANFMTAVANTRTLPETIEDSAEKVRAAWASVPRVSMTEHDDSHRDELPEELNASGYVGPYQFPDNSRRRIPGVLYLVIAALCVLVWFAGNDSLAWVNEGFLWAALALTVAGVISITSGWRMHVDETEALISAQRAGRLPGRSRVGPAGVARIAQPADVARAVLLDRGSAPCSWSGARRRGRRHRGRGARGGQPGALERRALISTLLAFARRLAHSTRSSSMQRLRRASIWRRRASSPHAAGTRGPPPPGRRRVAGTAQPLIELDRAERASLRANAASVETVSSSRGRRAPRRASRAGRADGAAPCARARRARR